MLRQMGCCDSNSRIKHNSALFSAELFIFEVCCNGFFPVVSFYFYTIFTPRLHGALWIYMVFCELPSLKNHCNMGIYVKK